MKVKEFLILVILVSLVISQNSEAFSTNLHKFRDNEKYLKKEKGLNVLDYNKYVLPQNMALRSNKTWPTLLSLEMGLLNLLAKSCWKIQFLLSTTSIFFLSHSNLSYVYVLIIYLT